MITRCGFTGVASCMMQACQQGPNQPFGPVFAINKIEVYYGSIL